MNSKINSSVSFLSKLPNNISLLEFKKNTKTAKLILLTELLYIVISQSRNYNNLYINLIFQIEIIKKKIFEDINEKLILKNGLNIVNIFKLKLKKDNINYYDFIKNIVFSDNKISFLINNVLKRANLEIDNQFISILKSLQEELNSNNLLIKYKYLKKIQLYLKQFTFNKFKDINSFFYPILFNLLKKETHRIKLKKLLRKIITKYVFKGLNIELSKEKLQSSLLRYFRISNKFNVRLIPYIEELHLKARKPIRNKKDIMASSNRIISDISTNFGISYFKLLKMLKKNKLDSIPISEFFKKLLNLQFNNFSSNLIRQGLDFFIIEDNYLIDLYNKKINIFNINQKNQLYQLDKENNIINRKHFCNIYFLYNLYHSISKKKKYNFHISSLEKKMEYFSLSDVKYYYYDQLFLQIEKNEINNNELKNYIIIKKLISYIKRYKALFISINNIKKYFKNFDRNEKKKNLFKGIKLKNFRINILIYFFKNLYNLYYKKFSSNDNSKLLFKTGKEINIKSNINLLFKEIKYIKSIINYLLTLNQISFKFLNKKKKEIKTKFKNITHNYIENYFYNLNNKFLYNKSKNNFIFLKDIKKTISLFNLSEELNKYYIYNQYNNIYKKYFSFLRKILLKKAISFSFISLINNKNANKKWLNKYLLEIFNIKLMETIPLFNKSSKVKYLDNNLLANKVFNIDFSNIKLEELNSYLMVKNLNMHSFFLNITLKNYIYQLYQLKTNFKKNKEIIKSMNNNITISNNIKIEINKLYYNNFIIVNNINTFNSKEIYILENNNDYFFKKLMFYKKIILLSKYQENLIFKKNNIFILNNNHNFDKLSYIDLIKIKNSFNSENYNQMISKTIDYTTTELKKITKHQMKKRRLKKIY